MKRILSAINAFIGFLCLAMMVITIVGPSLYMEISGIEAGGRIVAKREVISPMNEMWSRHLFVDVRYQPPDTEESEVAAIAVPASTYDQLRVGTPVEIRFPPNPLLRQIGNVAGSRLTSQWPFESFVALIGSFLWGILLGIGIWLVLLWAWSKWKHWSLTVAILGLMFGSALYFGSGWPAPQPPGELLPASATVRTIKRIDRVWGGKRTAAEEAVQPFVITQLSFVPTGNSDPVIAVDMVDDTSVPGLKEGAIVALHYSAADPRWARIDNASRTYYWKNMRSFGIIALIIIGLVAFSWLFNRRRKVKQARSAQP